MAAKEPTYAHSFRYDITTLKPGETVLSRWPQLATHEKFVTYGFGDNNKYFLYAIYLGQGSGLHTAIPEWEDRKREAARLAGIKPTDPRYEDVLALKDDATQELRWEWLMLTSSRLYQAYVVGCEVYLQTCRKAESPIIAAVEPPQFVDLSKGKPGSADLKADAEIRAHRGRIELWGDLAPMDEKLVAMEAKLFFGDDDMKRLAIEAAKPTAKRGGFEDLVLNNNKR